MTRSSVTPAFSGVDVPAHPVRHDHPGVERGADDRAARDQLADVLVRELAIVRDDRAAVGMARPDRAAEVVERVAEAVVAEVRRVEDDVQPLHLAQQLVAARPHPAARIRALGVDAGAVMRRTDGAQALRVRALEMPAA